MEFVWTTRVIFSVVTALADHQLRLTSAYSIGVNYGLNGDNLPSPADVINLYNKCGINFIRIFEPRHEVLDALQGKSNLLSLGTRNEDIESLASSQDGANQWVNTNIIPYFKDVNIGYITVENEVIPRTEAPYIAKAIGNILQALYNAGVSKDIKVTTVVSMKALAASHPPSAGDFSEEAVDPLKDILQILVSHGAPIMLNVYPYFAYASDPEHISLEYALFKSKEAVVKDGKYEYFNLFDAMVDSFYAAMEKIGVGNVRVDVAETGWPSAGNEPYTSKDNAETYNSNFMEHVLSERGTPRRQNQSFNAFMFEMFNEDLKPVGIEQNLGFFYPNMQPVYSFWSSC